MIGLITRIGLASERDVAEASAEVLDLPLVSTKDLPDQPPQNVQMSLRFLKQHHLCPIGEGESQKAEGKEKSFHEGGGVA